MVFLCWKGLFFVGKERRGAKEGESVSFLTMLKVLIEVGELGKIEEIQWFFYEKRGGKDKFLQIPTKKI